MPKQEFPFPMPNGWFCIVRSHELENGGLKQITFRVCKGAEKHLFWVIISPRTNYL